LDPERCIAIIPVGAVEAHGPHLPVITDTVINEGVVTAFMRKMQQLQLQQQQQQQSQEADGGAGLREATLLVLPTQSVGCSLEHMSFPGTISHSQNRLVDMWTDVGDSIARAGLRKVMFVNSHGGQPQAVDIVALILRKKYDMLVVKANLLRFALPAHIAEKFGQEELDHGIHGGAVETSMMLHLAHHLVDQTKFANFRSSALDIIESAQFKVIQPEGGPCPFAWASEDLHVCGACGDPRLASAELGAEIVDHLATVLSDAVSDMLRFHRLQKGPAHRGCSPAAPCGKESRASRLLVLWFGHKNARAPSAVA
jgi:creatinine amidohydrolase